MSFTILNQTNATVGPYNGHTIAAFGSLFVSDDLQQVYAQDDGLKQDAFSGIVWIQFGTIPANTINAWNLLNTIAAPQFAFGGDQRLRVGQETILFFDPIDGSAVNTLIWEQSQTGMAQSVSGGYLTLNSGSSTTATNFSILSSNKKIQNFFEFPAYVQFQARLIPKNNSVIELGFGTLSGTSAPADGVFLRIDSSGVMKFVINFNGTETSSSTIPALDPNQFYLIEIFTFEDHAKLEITNIDGSYDIDLNVFPPNTQGALTSNSHQSIVARVYNSGTPASAPQIVISNAICQRLDLNKNKQWSDTSVSIGRSGVGDPTTYLQTANFVNSTAPVTAALSNSTPSYSSLGGQFAFNAPAGAETDYLIFAYQIPDSYQFYITATNITAANLGSTTGVLGTVLQWGIAVNSSAASLATGSPSPPFRIALGIQSMGKNSDIGTPYSPSLYYSMRTPLVCDSGKYVQIFVKVPSGLATSGQIIRGTVTIEGYFE